MTTFKKLFLHSPVRYIVAFVISSVIALLYLIINGWNYKIYYLDAFTTGGMVTVLFGLLVLVSHFGAFDTFAYGFSTFKRNRRYKDLVEYTDAKRIKRASNHFTFMPYVTVGLLFIIIGLIFLF
jgi:hypothetical protein